MPRPHAKGLAFTMGVPGLFGWLRRKYPEIVAPAPDKAEPSGPDGPDTEATACDNLYIGAFHSKIRMRIRIARPRLSPACLRLILSNPANHSGL